MLALASEGHAPERPVSKLDHADLGQMQLCVNWYDREVLVEGDDPTIGLILRTQKNDAVVRYVLAEANRQIIASRCQLFLPMRSCLLHQRSQVEHKIVWLPSEHGVDVVGDKACGLSQLMHCCLGVRGSACIRDRV